MSSSSTKNIWISCGISVYYITVMTFSVFLIFCLVWRCIPSPTPTSNAKTVALCIQGQIRRWLPEYVVPNVIEPNPNFQFVFFVNLQYSTSEQKSQYSTHPELKYDPANISHTPFEESLTSVHERWTTARSTVAQISFHHPLSREYFLNEFHVSDLNVITQYPQIQHLILNMYSHEEQCIDQMMKYEQKHFENSNRYHNHKFDFVLSLREDAYFFKPLNLSTLLNEYLLNPKAKTLKESVASLPNVPGCHIIHKSCLRWGGLSMRGQFMHRDDAESFFGGRLAYYNQSLVKKEKTHNPEQWELKQLHELKLRGCDVPVELFPVTAARVKDNDICFIPEEIVGRCFPAETEQFVWDHECLK